MGIAYPSFEGTKRVGGMVVVAGFERMMEPRLRVPERVCPMFEVCIVCMVVEIVCMIVGKKVVFDIVAASICMSAGLSRIELFYGSYGGCPSPVSYTHLTLPTKA